MLQLQMTDQDQVNWEFSSRMRQFTFCGRHVRDTRKIGDIQIRPKQG
jgi:Ser-tRNA(Ala) deacylase AlaX